MSTDLLTRAHARLEEVLQDRPELAEAVRLQRALLETVIDELEELRATGYPSIPPDPAWAADRLQQGKPAIDVTCMPAPDVDFRSILIDLCSHLAEGGAGETASRVRDAVADGRFDAASLVGASLARDHRRIRSSACQLGFSPDLLWLVGELAAGPVAHLLQERLFHDGAAPLPQLLASWPHGYCPACGSWPALAEMSGGCRVLRCSFCAADWQPEELRCIYCGDDTEAFVLEVPDPARRERRLELCERCRGYLKAIPADAPAHLPLLAIEDLASADLDVMAMERGFSRPPLHEAPAVLDPDPDA